MDWNKFLKLSRNLFLILPQFLRIIRIAQSNFPMSRGVSRRNDCASVHLVIHWIAVLTTQESWAVASSIRHHCVSGLPVIDLTTLPITRVIFVTGGRAFYHKVRLHVCGKCELPHLRWPCRLVINTNSVPGSAKSMLALNSSENTLIECPTAECVAVFGILVDFGMGYYRISIETRTFFHWGPGPRIG
jgi:hypothetical protein